MHCKRRYKFHICSVVLGKLDSFRNYKGLHIIFPENFRCSSKFYESENFSDSSPHDLFEKANLGTEMRKIILRKL